MWRWNRCYAAMEKRAASRDRQHRKQPSADMTNTVMTWILSGMTPMSWRRSLTAVLQGYTQPAPRANWSACFRQYTLTLTEEIQIRTYHGRGWRHPRIRILDSSCQAGEPADYSSCHRAFDPGPAGNVSGVPADAGQQAADLRRRLCTNTSDSENLDGVEFVNGTRPGNSELVELAKRQVGNVGGQPYWSWYGFNSRVEWCACFVSWCYGQMGLSEPRFAACQSQGIPWFHPMDNGARAAMTTSLPATPSFSTGT